MTETTFPLLRSVRSEYSESGPPTGWIPVVPWQETRPDEPQGFVLQEVIGSGGMGVVHRARDLLLARDVAVKLLHSRLTHIPMASARFFEEACITAQLQHPGVPAVYHAGATPSGRPFLAMKLIVGETLHAILRDGKPINALAIFEAICQAVGYAHSRGVIHRDLKPGNVMVGAFGEVQVMDWGIAKVLGENQSRGDLDPVQLGQLTQADGPTTPNTLLGSAIGTPAYMAPEQAKGLTDQITRRSDVFGLGGLLCVLLTGKPPFDGDNIDEERAASARGDLRAAFERLNACRAEPDVIALCKRCLSADPMDRPVDGGAVAREVATLRSAADERARQAELDVAQTYGRVQEQARRRRLMAIATTSIVVALVVGLVGVIVGLLHVQESRRLAEEAFAGETEQRFHAEMNAREAVASKARTEAALKLTEDILAFARPEGQDRGLGIDVTLRQAVDEAAKKLEELFSNDPLTEARLRHTLAITYENLGDLEASLKMFDRVVSLLQVYYGPDHADTLIAQNNKSRHLISLGRYQESEKLSAQIVQQLKAKLGPQHPSTIKGLAVFALAVHSSGRLEEAKILREEIVSLSQSQLGPDHLETLRHSQDLATSLSAVGLHAEALNLQLRCSKWVEEKYGSDHHETLVSLQKLALRHFAVGQYDLCLKLNLRIQENSQLKLGPEHPSTLRSANSLASCYTALNRNEEAVKIRIKIIPIQKRTLGPDHPDVIASMNNLGATLARLNRHEEALQAYSEVFELSRNKHGLDHPTTLKLGMNVGHTYRQLKREKEALPILEDVTKRMVLLLPPRDATFYWATFQLASCYIALGQAPKATIVADEYLRLVHGKGVDPKWVAAVLGVRNEEASSKKDAAGCRKTAEIAESFAHTGLDELHDYAGYRAIAADAWDAAGNKANAEQDAAQSMVWLNKAVVAGLDKPERLMFDNDLKFLRNRPDFQKLIASLRRETAPNPRQVSQ